jgi:hypothetical protein
MKWTVDKIVEWHQMAMPNATIDQQTNKVEDELHELNTAASLYIEEAGPQGEALEELADVYISSVVLAKRFNSSIGVVVYNFIMDSIDRLAEQGTEGAIRLLSKIYKAIDEKMDKNVHREWEEISPGYYQHKETENDRIH